MSSWETSFTLSHEQPQVVNDPYKEIFFLFSCSSLPLPEKQPAVTVHGVSLYDTVNKRADQRGHVTPQVGDTMTLESFTRDCNMQVGQGNPM